jgi:hypothetical protein
MDLALKTHLPHWPVNYLEFRPGSRRIKIAGYINPGNEKIYIIFDLPRMFSFIAIPGWHKPKLLTTKM